MEYSEELKTFIKIWFLAISSSCYVYLFSLRIQAGVLRLLSILPVIVLFVILPHQLTNFHLAFPTFFYLLWLGNSKLILLAFNRGPLASIQPLSLGIFVSIALFPINPIQTVKNVSYSTSVSIPFPSLRSILLVLKVLLLAIIIQAYQYRESIHPYVILALYSCHVYLLIELSFAISTFFVRIFLGFRYEIEPQFNEPYLSTSLQEYWGKRWNIMATRILCLTVYDPISYLLTPFLGKTWSRFPAILVTFFISGLFHELFFYYATHVPPTWEVTWYFVVQGVGVALEVAIKKAVRGKFRLHGAISGPLTMAYVSVTCVWLFLPQLTRNGIDVKILNEYSDFVNLLRSTWEWIVAHIFA